ncbi:rod shape-determining protein MreD [Fredinandcohnia humi]
MKRFILPFIVTFFFLFESSFVDLVPSEIFHDEQIFVPRFLMILIVFITIYHNKIGGLLYGIILGLLYDVVYTEVLGVYMFSMPLIAYIISQASRILQTNIIIISFLSIFGIAILELFVYGVNLAIGIATMSFDRFLELRQLPTLLLNSIFITIFSYPIKKLLGKLQIQE